ncbi:MAG: glycosyltransferase family 39 protein, partial [Bacteroidota bacterium]
AGSTFSIFLLARLTGVTNYLLFAALCFSPMIMQVGGFIAAPDIPMIFFILLFFLVYKKYLEKESFMLSVLWGFIMAAMIYSKYNGILVIFFTILSNLSLLKKRFFYIAAASAVAFFIPHILWSVYNDYPTIYYHLIERNYSQTHHLQYFLEFIGGQFGIYGPLMAPFFIWFTFTYKTEGLFERSLKFSAIGTLLFFLLYTMRGQVEPNWTLPAFMPMIILTYRSLVKREKIHKTIYYLAATSVILMIFFRVYLVHDFLKLPRKLVNLSELYDWKEWSNEIEKLANGRPVIFINSYQRASKYTFYSGKQATTVEDFNTHRTQYYYWNDLEKNLQGKEVFIAGFASFLYFPDRKEFTWKNGVVTYYQEEKNFLSFYHVPLKTMLAKLTFPANSEILIPIRIFNRDEKPLRFDQDSSQRSRLVYHFIQQGPYVVEEVPSTDITKMVIRGKFADTTMVIRTPSQPGRYHFWVSIKTGWMRAGHNENNQIMDVY